MASDTLDQPRRSPWEPVGDGMANPSPASARMTPQPIEADDSDVDIVRPVASPPAEETFPTTGRLPLDGMVPDEPDDPITHPFRALGQSAVTNASFSAGGAHTPMGGVPLPRAKVVPPPTPPHAGLSPFADITNSGGGAPFVPTFAARESAPTASQPTVSFPSPVPQVPDGPVDNAPPHHSGGGHDGEPWWRSLGALVAYGVIIMAGVAVGLFTTFASPAAVTLPAAVLIESTHDNGIPPIELIAPTDFLAGVPVRTATHTLTEVQSLSLAEIAELPGRTAEVHDLTYYDGVTTYAVRAYQHFTTADAVATFDALAADAPSFTPVEVSGEQVGAWVELATDDGPVIVWRNTTAVFELTGPEDGILEFFTLFGW